MRTRWVREGSVTDGGGARGEVRDFHPRARFPQDPGDGEARGEVVVARDQGALLEAGVVQCVVAYESSDPESGKAFRDGDDAFEPGIAAAGRRVGRPGGRGERRIHLIVIA